MDAGSRPVHHGRMRRWSDVLARFDWTLLLAVLALTSVGLLAIYGISVARGATELFQFKKQLTAAGLGLVAASVLAFVDYRHIRSLALPIYAVGFLILIASLIFGTTLNGGGRWFILGPLSFQPVEFAKVCFVVFVAQYLGRYVRKRLDWMPFLGSLFALLVYLVPILLQPDFGSGMVVVAAWIAMVLFAGLPKHAWWILTLVAAAMAPLVWMNLEAYQKDRLLSFVNPDAHPRAAYNVTQARIAIGSGGIFGKGIGAGSQARLRFLPVATSDFMFAVLGEEIGFVGIFGLLGVFGLLFFRLLRIGSAVPDPFAGLLVVGVVAILATHVAVNAGMNLGLVPVTGIPLPFVSAAASSLITLYLLIGLAESVAVQRRTAS